MRVRQIGNQTLPAEPKGSSIGDTILELTEMENRICKGVLENGDVLCSMGWT